MYYQNHFLSRKFVYVIKLAYISNDSFITVYARQGILKSVEKQPAFGKKSPLNSVLIFLTALTISMKIDITIALIVTYIMVFTGSSKKLKLTFYIKKHNTIIKISNIWTSIFTGYFVTFFT
jgi:hypothetical protein